MAVILPSALLNINYFEKQPSLNKSASIEFPCHSTKKVKSIAVRTFSVFTEITACLKKIIIVRRIIAIVFAPEHICNIIKSVKSLVNKKVDREKRIESSLNIIHRIGSLGDTVAAFVLGLENAGKITAKGLSWARPFAIGMAVLSIASIVSRVRECLKAKQLSRDFALVEVSNGDSIKGISENYHDIIALIRKKQAQEKNFVKATFSISENQLTSALLAREIKAKEKLDSSDPITQAEGEEILRKTQKCLMKRIQQNISSSRLAAITSIISVIGTTIWLCFPAIPVGWGILAVVGLIDCARLINRKVCEYKFAKELDLKLSWRELILS